MIIMPAEPPLNRVLPAASTDADAEVPSPARRVAVLLPRHRENDAVRIRHKFVRLLVQGKVLELKQGRSHGESKGANCACIFPSNARFGHTACHCCNSGTVSTQGLLPCTVSFLVFLKKIFWILLFLRCSHCIVGKIPFGFSFFFFSSFFLLCIPLAVIVSDNRLLRCVVFWFLKV